MKAPALVLALVDDAQAALPGVRVLYRFQATPGDTGRHGLAVADAVRHSDQVAPLLTVLDVAGILGVTPRTVERYVRDGRLVAVDLGRSYRFAPADIAAFVAEHRTCGNGSPSADLRELNQSANPGGPPPARPALGPRGPMADTVSNAPMSVPGAENGA